ncbi:sensor histidine kinase [Brevibacillus dissolubilis]|uniref:sensor histidine kinase n=1 Tax=Brevibacillus dissolubilis TaxID=1844116 RepID=UPI001116EC6A|nr:HAMP domain-containing sensor histidine kinase [Brevibacillus dissolubilis]
MTRWWAIVCILMGATAVAGELKFIPFFGMFRISLGGAVFFFLLLLYKPKRLPLVGLLVGGFVVAFRMILDYTWGTSDGWMESFMYHLPAMGYYLMFALLCYVIRLNRMVSPLLIGFAGAMIDFSCNAMELTIRMLLESGEWNVASRLVAIFSIGMIRSFLVVGIYNMLETRQLQAVHAEQQKRVDKLLLFLSGMHEERLYLQKMMNQVEEVTLSSYQLYRKLNGNPCAADALRLAEQVHEVKKDAQRIVANLTKNMKQEKLSEEMEITDIVRLVVQANAIYAEHIGKRVQFSLDVQADWTTNRYYSLLSVCNNLVANAIEAMEKEQGFIRLRFWEESRHLMIEVKDDGPGISQADQRVIFQPGYTTKYDSKGNASTGIGLVHVASIVKDLGGTVQVESVAGNGTLFRIIIPKLSLQPTAEKSSSMMGTKGASIDEQILYNGR